MKAKVALKRYAATSNIKNRHYYTDKGRFGEIIFKNEVQWHGQIISLCETILSHAQSRWRKAINAIMQPYPIRLVNKSYISTPVSMMKDGESLVEIFH
jgi:hypothetical protein